LRHALGNVEQHGVTELLKADQVSQGAADLARTDQCDLVSRHQKNVLILLGKAGLGVISRFG
jgi:hypothetical protein